MLTRKNIEQLAYTPVGYGLGMLDMFENTGLEKKQIADRMKAEKDLFESIMMTS